MGPTNITAFLGDRVELQCKVSGRPQPKVQWFSKREGKLPSIGPNFRVHRNNSLIFRRIEKRDESYYHCEVENIKGKVISRQARLTVEGNNIWGYSSVKVILYLEFCLKYFICDPIFLALKCFQDKKSE